MTKSKNSYVVIEDRYQKNAVNFEIFDNTESSGTIVKIALCKKTDYDKIKK